MVDGFDRFMSFISSITDVPTEQLQRLRQVFRPLTLAEGEHFIHAGTLSKRVGFIVSGLLRYYYITPDGTDYTKLFCVEGDAIAAYSAQVLNEPPRFSVEALEESLLLVSDFDTLAALANDHPCWQAVQPRLLERLYIKKLRREEELLLDDATTRYKKFLAEYPGLEARVKQYHVASYLGITPVSLSRIRAQLRSLT